MQKFERANFEIKESDESNNYAKFVIEPLERGFGTTIGNSLRRVLLSSMPGGAVYSVKIDNVYHEFTAIDGVVEDVTAIILNIKELVMLIDTDETYTLRINEKGPKTVTAGDIELPTGVEILNPDHVIATIAQGGEFVMEMKAKNGRGYVSADDNKQLYQVGSTQGIGTIYTDSIYTPIEKVSYSVEPTRVGQNSHYDKLTLEIWTNGAVRPDDALAYAAKIIKEQLTVFINFDEVEDVEKKADESLSNRPKLNENLFKTVDSLELSVRAANCLENANIRFIGELVTRTESDMLKTKNFGRKSLNEIKDILAEMGLYLGMKIEGFDPAMLRRGEMKG